LHSIPEIGRVMFPAKVAEWQKLRIPAKANAVPKGSRTVFRAEAEHYRSVATLAF
jgi:hypothetical protein